MKIYIDGKEYTNTREIAAALYMGRASLWYSIEKKRRDLNVEKMNDKLIQEVVDKIYQAKKGKNK